MNSPEQGEAIVKTIKRVMVFPNLMLAACDDRGEQIPELQRSLVGLWIDHAVQAGYDPEGVIVETIAGHWRIVKNPDGSWNREAA